MSKYYKEPFCDCKLLKKVNNYYLGKVKDIITWSRSSVILPRFIGLTFFVHNGKRHLPVLVTEEMVGHKLGEFSITRNFKGHPKNKNNKK